MSKLALGLPLVVLWTLVASRPASAQDVTDLTGTWTRDHSVGTEPTERPIGIPQNWFTRPSALVIKASPAEVAITKSFSRGRPELLPIIYTNRYRFDGTIGAVLVEWNGQLVITQQRPAGTGPPGVPWKTLVTREVYSVRGRTLTVERSLRTISHDGAVTYLDRLTYAVIFVRE